MQDRQPQPLVDKGWGRCRSAGLIGETNLRHVLQHQVSGDMFCEQVRRIVGASDLIQSEVAALQPVLDPQVADMQVAYFAEPTASANSDCRRSIRV